jgi:hypothetical protein
MQNRLSTSFVTAGYPSLVRRCGYPSPKSDSLSFPVSQWLFFDAIEIQKTKL